MKNDTLEPGKTSCVLPLVPEEANGIRALQNANKHTLELLTNTLIYDGFIDLSTGLEMNCQVVIFSAQSDTLNDLLKSVIEWAYNEDDKSKVSPDVHYYFVPLKGADDSFWAVARLFADLGMGTIVSVMNFLAAFCANQPKRQILPTKKVLRDTLEARYFHSGATEIQELLLRDASLTHKLMGGGARGPAIRLLLGAWCSGDINLTSDQVVSVLSSLNNHREIPRAEIEEMEGKVNSYRKIVNSKHISKLSDHANGRTILLVEDRLKEEGWDIVIPLVLGGCVHSQIQKEGTTEDYEYVVFRLEEGKSLTLQNDSDYSPGEFRLVHCHTAREALLWLQKNKPKDLDLVLLDLYSSTVPPASHSKGAHPVTISQEIWELVLSLRKQNPDPTKKKTEPAILAFTAEENPMTVHMLSTELGITHFFFKSPSVAIHKSAYYASFRNAMIGALTQSICHNLSLSAERQQNHFTRWFLQFREEHRPLILRLMRHFQYFSAKDIITILGNGINEFVKMRFHADKPRFWISYLGRPNKSGPATLSLFGKSDWVKENANSVELLSYSALQQRISWYESCQFWEKEVVIHENRHWKDKRRVCVLLLDDVIGTGGQIQNYLSKLFAHYTPGHSDGDGEQANILLKNLQKYEVEFHIVYALGIGTEHPNTVSAEHNGADYSASLSVIYCPTSLDTLDTNLKNDVVRVLGKYPLIIETRRLEFPCEFEPLGWKGEIGQRNGRGNGGLFSTYANTPGNTLPVIWGNEKGRWECLFSRVFNPCAKERDVDQAKSVMECKAQNKCILDEKEHCRSRKELENILERDDV